MVNAFLGCSENVVGGKIYVVTLVRISFEFCSLEQLSLTYSVDRFWADCSHVRFSAPNLVCLSQTPFQSSGLDTSRTTRHHGLVDRVYRDRNRLGSPHRRPLSVDKHGRQISFGSRAGSEPPPFQQHHSFPFSQFPLSSLLTSQWCAFPSRFMSSAASELSAAL